MKTFIALTTILVLTAQIKFTVQEENCNVNGSKIPCPENSKCYPLGSGFSACVCNVGYESSADNKQCTAITCTPACTPEQVCVNDGTGTNVCQDFSSTACTADASCGAGGSCVTHPTMGKFCQCAPGYEYDDETNNKCKDIASQCTPNPCGEGNTCVDIDGGYTCTCGTDQFFMDGTCKAKTDTTFCNDQPCDPNTRTCVMQFSDKAPPQEACVCKTGFYETDTAVCAPYDQCKAFRNAECQVIDPNSECVFADFATNCVCKHGFEKIEGATQCTDINECANVTCGANEQCVNEVGGKVASDAQCVCNQGYWHNGTACVEDTICPTVQDCHANAKCVPNATGYECVCNTDYVGDGKSACFECQPRFVEVKASSGIISLHTFDGVIKSLLITAVILVCLSNIF